MVVNVVLITGERLEFKLDKKSCTIGRSAQCDVVIPHESVSRKHCQIDFVNGELFVMDLGSINGVSIEGQKITPNKPVQFQSFLTLSFGAVQSLNVDLPEERTAIGVNPLFATTLPQEKKSPKPMKIARETPKAEIKKTAEEQQDLPMNNFVILCVMVVIGFALFIFREELMPLFGM